MLAFGASQEQVNAAIASRAEADKANEKPYIIEYNNWDAYEIFCRVQTQWNLHGFTGQKIGLQYSAVIDVIKLLHADNADVIFGGVQLIEHGFLSEVNKRG